MKTSSRKGRSVFNKITEQQLDAFDTIVWYLKGKPVTIRLYRPRSPEDTIDDLVEQVVNDLR